MKVMNTCWVILVKKAQARIWTKNFPTFKFVTISFFTWKLNPLGLRNCSVPNFCETCLRYFAVCSLVPRMNLPHTLQSYLRPKNQNYLLEKANLRFFLSYGLRTTIKSKYSVLFMLQIVFQAVIVAIHAKNTDSFNKTFF